ncbi:hypothetical protein Bca101_028398 [Brassica carinata]
MVLKACAVASWTDRDSSNLRRLDGSIFSSSQTLLSHDGKGRVFNRLERELGREPKAELDPEDEEESDGEIEEDKIEESEDDKIDLLEVPEWDVDSFDGVVYTSSSEPDLPPRYQPYENMENAKEHYRIYKQQLITSKGFMVDPLLRPSDRHNQDKDSNVEFVEVVRENYRGGPRPKSYITFMAREKPDGPLVEYQAKAMATLDRKFHPILCRPAPTN